MFFKVVTTAARDSNARISERIAAVSSKEGAGIS